VHLATDDRRNQDRGPHLVAGDRLCDYNADVALADCALFERGDADRALAELGLAGLQPLHGRALDHGLICLEEANGAALDGQVRRGEFVEAAAAGVRGRGAVLVCHVPPSSGHSP